MGRIQPAQGLSMGCAACAQGEVGRARAIHGHEAFMKYKHNLLTFVCYYENMSIITLRNMSELREKNLNSKNHRRLGLRWWCGKGGVVLS